MTEDIIQKLVALAERDRDAIVKFAKHTLGWSVSPRRIRAITVNTGRLRTYNPRGRPKNERGTVRIAVGQPLDARLADMRDEPVLMILQSNTFLVCTLTRGVLRGEPYLFGDDEVIRVEEDVPVTPPGD